MKKKEEERSSAPILSWLPEELAIEMLRRTCIREKKADWRDDS